MKDTPLFSTRDLTLAATLITLKYAMIGVDYQFDGGSTRPVGFFKFEESPALTETRQKYMQGMIEVEPKFFMSNLNSLKAEVMNAFKIPHYSVFKK